MASRSSAKVTDILRREKQPTTVAAWRKEYANKFFTVRFDNGELMTISIGQMEPEGDFSTPLPGNSVCVKVKGAKYNATIIEEVLKMDGAKSKKSDLQNSKQAKIKKQREVQLQKEYFKIDDGVTSTSMQDSKSDCKCLGAAAFAEIVRSEVNTELKKLRDTCCNCVTLKDVKQLVQDALQEIYSFSQSPATPGVPQSKQQTLKSKEKLLSTLLPSTDTCGPGTPSVPPAKRRMLESKEKLSFPIDDFYSSDEDNVATEVAKSKSYSSSQTLAAPSAPATSSIPPAKQHTLKGKEKLNYSSTESPRTRSVPSAKRRMLESKEKQNYSIDDIQSGEEDDVDTELTKMAKSKSYSFSQSPATSTLPPAKLHTLKGKEKPNYSSSWSPRTYSVPPAKRRMLEKRKSYPVDDFYSSDEENMGAEVAKSKSYSSSQTLAAPSAPQAKQRMLESKEKQNYSIDDVQSGEEDDVDTELTKMAKSKNYSSSPATMKRVHSSTSSLCLGSSGSTQEFEYINLGGVKILSTKLKMAQRQPTPFRMGRKLVFDIFSPAELMECSTVPGKPGRTQRPLVNENKMRLILDEIRKIFPSGWTEVDMLRKLNQAFIDYRKNNKSC